MNRLFALVTLVYGVVGFAGDIAPTLRELSIVNVQTTGRVLKNTYQHPFSTFLLAIPAEIELPDACTEFVGQKTTPRMGVNKIARLQAIGAFDPLTDACIAVEVPPVKTTLTYAMKVLTGGILPAQGNVNDLIRLGNRTYKVTLNVDTMAVTVFLVPNPS